jgi:Zn-dependent protease
MLRSWKIGRAFGIAVYVHWSFLLLLGWVILSGPPGADRISYGIYMGGLLLAVFGCVLLHELGHALTARAFGITTRSITLYIVGGVARLERMTEKPWEELWIAIAGPAVNVAIAALLTVGLLIGFVISPQNIVLLPEVPATHVSQFMAHLLVINCFLVVFNLIPAYPMDGGRVLRALLALRMGQLRATEVAVPVGAAVGLLAMSGFALWFGSPLPLLIALFVVLAGQQELYALRMRARQAQNPTMEVLPVVKPVNPQGLGPSTVLDLRPTISVYSWDPKTGGWVREQGSRPIRVQWGNTE